MGWRHHEVGKVHISEMEMTLRAAHNCGFHASLDRRQPFSLPSTGVVEDHEEQDRRRCFGERPSSYNEAFLPRPSAGATPLRDPPYRAAGNSAVSTEDLPATSIKNTAEVITTTSRTLPQPGERATQMEAFRGGGGGAAPLADATGLTLEESFSVAATEVAPTVAAASDGTEGDEGDLLRMRISSLPKPVPAPPEYCRVVVVGGGASGLSVAACLRCRGEESVLVLERYVCLCLCFLF